MVASSIIAVAILSSFLTLLNLSSTFFPSFFCNDPSTLTILRALFNQRLLALLDASSFVHSQLRSRSVGPMAQLPSGAKGFGEHLDDVQHPSSGQPKLQVVPRSENRTRDLLDGRHLDRVLRAAQPSKSGESERKKTHHHLF